LPPCTPEITGGKRKTLTPQTKGRANLPGGRQARQSKKFGLLRALPYLYIPGRRTLRQVACCFKQGELKVELHNYQRHSGNGKAFFK
jgi:hypothetical protein